MSLPHRINKRLNISYINVWTINLTVLELDFVASNLFVFLKYSILLIHVVCGPMVEIYHSSYSKYYVAVVTMVTYVVVIVIAPDVQLINTSVWVAYDNNSYITNACRKLTLFPTSKCDEYFSRTYM